MVPKSQQQQERATAVPRRPLRLPDTKSESVRYEVRHKKDKSPITAQAIEARHDANRHFPPVRRTNEPAHMSTTTVVISSKQHRRRSRRFRLPPGATRKISANDRIQIALIGAGGMGSRRRRIRAGVRPGVEMVAAATSTTAGSTRAKERWGNGFFTRATTVRSSRGPTSTR